MTISLSTLVNYCEDLLSVGNFRDYCPNGLQVEGKSEVSRIVTGVTASQALLDAAVEAKADVVLVHHGYFWKGEHEPIVGIKKNRIKTLLDNDISLVAYHLPLDAHPEIGNNAQLARLMNWQVQSGLDGEIGKAIGLIGQTDTPITADELSQQFESVLNRPVQHIKGVDRKIQKIAWCTGAAQSYIDKALAAGCDAFVSGEISEPTVHIAREAGIDYFAAGHHATERYGVKALGEHLHNHFGIEHQFIDIDNPV